MIQAISTLTFLGLFFGFPECSEACTSFAVYSGNVFYAMNFDFADLPMKFLIAANGDIRTFHLAFERTLGTVSFFVNTAGMNDKGLFAACQELHPVNQHPREKEETDLYMFELYEAISACTCVNEIEERCQERALVDMPGITLHNLFADTRGEAMVTEAGEAGTHMVKKSGDYMVMTNFPVRTMAGKNYLAARGKGEDRYIICHEYLDRHLSDFSIENGFELLSKCRNTDPQYPTACSMVFDPQKKAVYIVMARNFSRIWKLSIENQTLETWRGFRRHLSIPVPKGECGIPAAALVQYAESRTT